MKDALKLLFSVVVCLLFVPATGGAQTGDFVIIDKLRGLHQEVMLKLSAQPRKALQVAQLAKKISGQIRQPDYSAQALLDVSHCYLYLARIDSAIYFARLSLQSNPNVHDSLRARAYGQIGSVFQQQGIQDSAIYFHLKGLRIREKLGQKSALVFPLYCLGVLSNAGEDKGPALYYFTRCLQVAEESKDKSLIAMAAEGMASYWYQEQLFDRAIGLFERSAELYGTLGNQLDQARSLLNLGNAYDETGRTQKSVDSYYKALGFFQSLGDEENILICFSNLGLSYLNLREYSRALHYLHKSRGMALRLQYTRVFQDVIQNLASLHKEQNKPDSALFYYESLGLLKDSLMNMERIKDINQLQETYQKEKREQEISSLKVQKTLREQEVNMERQQKLSLLTALMVLVLLAFAAVLILKQRAKNANKMAAMQEDLYRNQMHQVIKEHELKSINQVMEGQENERKRIAEDLHDRLGSMLSSIKLHFNAVEEKLDVAEMKTFQQYTRANNLLDDVVNEVRNIAHNMESGVLQSFGLLAALDDLKDTLKNTGALQIVISSFGMGERLSSDIEITVYRVIQELLSNTIRHSGAKKITIDLTRSREQLTVMYSDDGKGYEPAEPARTGMGLKHIQTRLSRLNGKFFVDSGNNNGTTSIIEIPLQDDKGTIGR